MFVLCLGILGFDERFNPPSIGSVVAFLPPSIKDAQVDHAVESGLLPARSARLQWKARGVEPDVDPLDEELCHVHIIVFQECDVAPQFMVIAKPQNLMNKKTARLIGRVSLSGKNQLDGAPLVMKQQFQSFEVAE